MKRLSILLSLLGALGLQGCAAPVELEPEGSSRSEVVTQDTFERAASVVRGIDYLSFGYTADGCYVRAFYMSAELAAEGIESNSIFAIARDEQNQLEIPGSDGTWSFHVAPMLNVATPRARGSARVVARVLDPGLSSTPLTHTAWVARMGHRPSDPGAPLLRAIDGAYLVQAQYQLDDLRATDVWYDVPSFDAMQPFRAVDFQSACGKMHAFLEAEGTPQRAKKQATLLARTQAVMTALEGARKLEGSASDFDAAACTTACRIVPGAPAECR